MLHLRHAELAMLWGALQRATWVRPVLFRQQVSAMGAVRVTTQYIDAVTNPGVVVAMIEDLVAEGRLRRDKANGIEETLLRNMDAHGCWQGNPWDGIERCGTLPPDVERFAGIGQA